jgi:phosphoglycolate phosphatase
MTRNPQAVVFDLDGTLVDTGPDLTAALNHCLREEGLGPVPLTKVRGMIGHGAVKLLERGLAFHSHNVGEARFNALRQMFLDFYMAHICVYSMPYPGVLEALDSLKSGGTTLGICTNKPVAMSHALIKALDMEEYFAANLGSDSLPMRKPDPQHLLGTLAAMNCDARDAVMVGDSMVDVNTARAANVPIIAVTFGFTDIPAKDFGADALLDHYNELHGALAKVR